MSRTVSLALFGAFDKKLSYKGVAGLAWSGARETLDWPGVKGEGEK